MSAQDNLNPRQFRTMSVTRMGQLHSAAWDMPMNEISLMPESGMAADVAAHGVREPIDLERDGGRVVVSDGNHRYVAARDANLPRVPVRLRPSGPHGVRMKEAKAYGVYTPPEGRY